MNTFQSAFKNASKFRFFNEIFPLALELTNVKGHQFISFECELPLEDKLLKKKRGTKGPTAVPCPYLGRNLRKLSYKNATANFSYDAKVESRGGVVADTKGNWIQAVVYKGRITPLATHKGDIVTTVKPGIDPNSADAKKWENRVAVMDDDDSIQFLPECVEPRLYLRYEIIRSNGVTAEEKADRNKRKMQVDAVHIIDHGIAVDADDLKDYLPVPDYRDDQTDYQLMSLANLVRLNAGGLVWQKMDYVYPVLPGEKVVDMVDLILLRQDDIDAARAKAKAVEQPAEPVNYKDPALQRTPEGQVTTTKIPVK